MKRKTMPRRRQAAAKALADSRFRPRIVRAAKLYSRKGRVPKGSGPFDSARSLSCVGIALGLAAGPS